MLQSAVTGNDLRFHQVFVSLREARPKDRRLERRSPEVRILRYAQDDRKRSNGEYASFHKHLCQIPFAGKRTLPSTNVFVILREERPKDPRLRAAPRETLDRSFGALRMTGYLS